VQVTAIQSLLSDSEIPFNLAPCVRLFPICQDSFVFPSPALTALWHWGRHSSRELVFSSRNSTGCSVSQPGTAHDSRTPNCSWRSICAGWVWAIIAAGRTHNWFRPRRSVQRNRRYKFVMGLFVSTTIATTTSDVCNRAVPTLFGRLNQSRWFDLGNHCAGRSRAVAQARDA